jgi:hypothetical protein
MSVQLCPPTLLRPVIAAADAAGRSRAAEFGRPGGLHSTGLTAFRCWRRAAGKAGEEQQLMIRPILFLDNYTDSVIMLRYASRRSGLARSKQ